MNPDEVLVLLLALKLLRDLHLLGLEVESALLQKQGRTAGALHGETVQ